jgi:hypothetical protein
MNYVNILNNSPEVISPYLSKTSLEKDQFNSSLLNNKPYIIFIGLEYRIYRIY